MNADYLKYKLKKLSVEIILPTESEIKIIDDFRKQVYQNKETSKSIGNFKFLLDKYSLQNHVLIACTELSIYTDWNSPKIIDLVRLQIEEGIKY